MKWNELSISDLSTVISVTIGYRNEAAVLLKKIPDRKDRIIYWEEIRIKAATILKEKIRSLED